LRINVQSLVQLKNKTTKNNKQTKKNKQKNITKLRNNKKTYKIGRRKKNQKRKKHKNSKYCKKITKNETSDCCLRQSLNRTNWTDSLFFLLNLDIFFSFLISILVFNIFFSVNLVCFPLVIGKGRIQDYFDILDKRTNRITSLSFFKRKNN